MRVAFEKMHGLGNDFVVIDSREKPVEMNRRLACAMADRKTGIGCDQLILLERAENADAKMRIFNADGSEAEACGNAARCVTRLIGDKAVIDTSGGIIRGTSNGTGACIDMGEPRFEWHEIPLAYAMNTAHMPVGWENLDNPAAVNIGNPHIVFFVDNGNTIDLERLGPLIENDPLFPERINVNIATITGAAEINLRVWERGAGLTRACGTGACATAVAAILRKLVTSPVTVKLPGGALDIAWTPGNGVKMTGPGTHVFSGTFDTDDFA